MYKEEKFELAKIMRRLYKMKLTTTLGGNISVRTNDNTVLITPSGTDKGEISPDDIGELTLNGKIVGNSFKPSIESNMHTSIYKNRPNIKAVIHAHPPLLSAFAASSAEIKNNMTVETYAILGDIAYADYALIGTKALATNCVNATKNANTILMRKHGALTLGKSLLEAFDRMEVFENAAKLTHLFSTDFSASLSALSVSEMIEIDKMLQNNTKK